jgi:hypothetical protein
MSTHLSVDLNSVDDIVVCTSRDYSSQAVYRVSFIPVLWRSPKSIPFILKMEQAMRVLKHALLVVW